MAAPIVETDLTDVRVRAARLVVPTLVEGGPRVLVRVAGAEVDLLDLLTWILRNRPGLLGPVIAKAFQLP